MVVLGLGAGGKVQVHGSHDLLRGPNYLKRPIWELFDGEKTQSAVRTAYSLCYATGEPQEVMVNNSVLRFVRADIPPQVLAWVSHLPGAESPPLDADELALLREYAEGLTTRQVADKLGISESTIRRMRDSIGHKLNMNGTVTAACVLAAKRGWL